jgi:hypothetical protein
MDGYDGVHFCIVMGVLGYWVSGHWVRGMSAFFPWSSSGRGDCLFSFLFPLFRFALFLGFCGSFLVHTVSWPVDMPTVLLVLFRLETLTHPFFGFELVSLEGLRSVLGGLGRLAGCWVFGWKLG